MKFGKRNVFLVLSVFLLLQSVATAQCFRLFHIERNKNNNIVCYDLTINGSKSIDKNTPIDVYWEMPDKNNARNTLSVIQNKLAYGFTINQINENVILFKLKAYPDRAIKAVYNSDKKQATAYTNINECYAILKKIYIHAIPPLYNSVEYIILVGLDPKTGKEVKEKIVNK